jgi:hypothetical protein
MGFLPLNAIVFDLLVEIFHPHFDIILPDLCIHFCNNVSDSANITWSYGSGLFISLFLFSCIPFTLPVLHSEWISLKCILNSVGERRQPWRTPLLISTDSFCCLVYFLSHYVLISWLVPKVRGQEGFFYIIYWVVWVCSLSQTSFHYIEIENVFLDSIQSLSQRKQHFTITKINISMLFKKIIAFYAENHARSTA